MARVALPKDFARLTADPPKHDWSDEQEAIFEWFAEGSGNLVVRARAGCTKTTSIIEGITRAPERRIVLTAFNKAIAEELQARLRHPGARARTLHALGMAFCGKHIPGLKVDTTGARARELAKRALVKLTGKDKAPGPVTLEIASLHTKIREILVDPYGDFERDFEIGIRLESEKPEAMQDLLTSLSTFAASFGLGGFPESDWPLERVVEAALWAVNFAKESTETIDFADMIFLPIVHGWAKPICDLLVVDEAQDMSQAQLRLAIASTKDNSIGGRICIVGDEKQAIYGFRGADSESLDRLKIELDAQELGLKTTYRCPKNVVALARQFVPDFRVAPEAPEGAVLDDLCYSDMVSLANPGDFILSRTNAPLVGACLALIRAGKVAYVKGREIGRGALALFDSLCGSRVRNGEAFREMLADWRRRAMEKILKQKDSKARGERLFQIMDQAALLEAVIDGTSSLDDARAKLQTIFADNKADAVMCSTVHKAKGLEAPQVFLIAKTFNRESDEESNICYVAVTRAKSVLGLVGRSEEDFIQGEREKKEWES